MHTVAAVAMEPFRSPRARRAVGWIATSIKDTHGSRCRTEAGVASGSSRALAADDSRLSG
jgi:hypothetical protein